MTLPVMLLVVHFVADFLFQTDWMALNKSKRWDALAAHVTVYTLTFFFTMVGWEKFPFVLAFCGVTWVTHFLTDAVTSRMTSAFWFFRQVDGSWTEWHYIPGRRHWFFVIIGLDQLIHALTLAATWTVLVGRHL